MLARAVATGAIVLGLVGMSNPAWAGALKVMSVDRRAMVVLDRPTIRRSGGTVTAAILSITNHGYLPAEFYDHPQRSSVAISCGSRTFSLDNSSMRPIPDRSAIARTADWLCHGVAPSYAIESGDFGYLARGYLAYVAVTPGVFFLYTP